MRLFVAINLPQAERARLHEAARPLRDADLPVRWVDPEALHLTVKFLGEVAESRQTDIEAAIERAVQQTTEFDLQLRGLGGFPNMRRPSVVWVGVGTEPPLLALQERVEEELVSLGFEKEDRDFHPHITLGRARDSRDRRLGDLATLAESFSYQSVVQAASLDLMRSFTGPRGARYECLKAVPIGTAGSV